jgi:hypothetical protein
MHQHHGDLEFRQVLLKRQIAINRYENIKLSSCLGQEFTVGDSVPSLLMNRADLKANDM